MSWYSALTFNFLSALTALLGFFVGVAIGTESQVANGWILAVAAGIFIYIALVDLVSSNAAITRVHAMYRSYKIHVAEIDTEKVSLKVLHLLMTVCVNYISCQS